MRRPKRGVYWFYTTHRGIRPHTHMARELDMRWARTRAERSRLRRSRGDVGGYVWADLNVRVLCTVRLGPDEVPAVGWVQAFLQRSQR